MRIDGVAAAREAWSRCDWQTAYEAAVACTGSEPGEEAERLSLLADAAWWLGRIDECIDAREAAYLLFEDAGDGRQAGYAAVWLYEHHNFRAQGAIAGGWLRRARRALDRDPDCIEHGALLLREAEQAHGRGDLDVATDIARRVLDLARRLPSIDLEAEALQTLGRLLIDRGEAEEGMANFDEAMLFVVEGRLGPYSTGKVYCSLIGACEALGDIRRAAEWTEATSRWARRHPFAIFPGICRVHRAMALGSRGELVAAEREAAQACTELVQSHIPNAAAAFAEMGDIRRRLGDLDGADEAFRRAEELCGQPPAGLALLRLAQARIDAATAIIKRALDDAAQHRLARARLLPAQVQIAVAAGDMATAAAAAAELAAVAADFGTATLVAAADSARGRLALATGDVDAACATIRLALARWIELDMPYEVGTMRTLLGQAVRQAGDDEGAAASFAAAHLLFEQLGARLDAKRVEDLTGRTVLPAGLTAREVEVLRLVAAGRANKEIAAELHLSGKTVARHLSNIFTKIGVSSRSAATAFAFEHHLVSSASR